MLKFSPALVRLRLESRLRLKSKLRLKSRPEFLPPLEGFWTVCMYYHLQTEII